MRRAIGVTLIGIACLAGCSDVAMTPVPAGRPLNACPVEGPGSIVAREGYTVVPPGRIVIGYEAWHNETPQSFACGAQSVLGGTTEVRSAAFDSGFIPWVATYDRPIPLAAPEAVRPRALVFRIEGGQGVLVETVEPQAGPQFGALGNFEADKPVGRYRMEVRSASGVLLAEVTFEIVD